MTVPDSLFEHIASEQTGTARLSIDASVHGEAVDPLVYGKFCEHLGSNIYNGMEAQVLRNPTFGKWRFAAGGVDPDGGVREQCDSEKIDDAIRQYSQRMGFSEASPLIDAHKAGCAFWWMRAGEEQSVRFSPDVGADGRRAQRVEVLTATGEGALRPGSGQALRPGSGQALRPRPGQAGIAQWIYLPLHRTRGYEFRVVARAAAPVELEVRLSAAPADGSAGELLASSEVSIERDWNAHTGVLEVPASANAPDDGLFVLSVVARAPANVVISRVLLYPDDHVGGADPDVIRLLREHRLPILRWPGGNFVSGYHWRDGVGPRDLRPTVPNRAWDVLEYNLFGTDEFITFCREVGCEPLICVNAGDGSPAEAAAWVEYCNGAPDTPMGRLRAENGHPEPYGVKYWEIGNEVYGEWQISWTTPGGYADRYVRFTEAMRKADPEIEILACGTWHDGEWNRLLMTAAADNMPQLAVHILEGGFVDGSVDPKELFHAFMAYPAFIGKRLRRICEQLSDAGASDPRAAITELQLFARFRHGGSEDSGSPKPSEFPSPSTISEALYDAMIIHECIRLGRRVSMVTHSATVNHGGGLRKTKERVWANPAHHGHVMGSPLAGGTPLGVRLTCPTYSTPGEAGNLPAAKDTPVLDAMAVLGDDGALCIMLVHRSADAGPVELTVDLGEFESAGRAEVVTIAGESPSDQNTPEQPDRITPRTGSLEVAGREVTFFLAPFSLTRVTFSPNVAQASRLWQ